MLYVAKLIPNVQTRRAMHHVSSGDFYSGCKVIRKLCWLWTVIHLRHSGLSVHWINSRRRWTTSWTTAYTTCLRLLTTSLLTAAMALLTKEKNVIVATHLLRSDYFHHLLLFLVLFHRLRLLLLLLFLHLYFLSFCLYFLPPLHNYRSSVNFRGARHFCPKNMYEKLTNCTNCTWCLPEKLWNARIFMISARKINKIP